MESEYRVGFQYDKRDDPKYIQHMRERMLFQLFSESLIPTLLNNPKTSYAVKLTVKDVARPDYFPLGMPDQREVQMYLEFHRAEQRIVEWVDYRPMNWMTLSQTAWEEMRTRVRAWWRRPLRSRLYRWQHQLARFEKRHFGASFQ